MMRIGLVILSIVTGAVMVFAAIRVSKQGSSDQLRDVSNAELAQADGKENRPCFVVLDQVVYEVKQGKNWKDGEHITSEGLAHCGLDLTAIIKESPHGKSIIPLLKKIGPLTQ